jgi:fimbrial chaperone protein
MRRLLVAGWLLLGSATPWQAEAASFALAPLGLSIASRDSSGSVTVTNGSDDPVVIQVKTLTWTQRDGKDAREETRELIVNPPIFKLGPGDQQLVRFASRMGPPREVESAYRVVFSEVPSREAPRSEPGFRIALAMDIPLYLEPQAAVAATPVRWQAVRTEKGVRITGENAGNVHFRVVNADFAAGLESLGTQGNVVILPRSRIDFDVSAPARGAAAIKLTAEDLASQPYSVDIALPPAP